jgi:hypothetical protein
VFIFQVCVDVCVVHHVWHDGVPGGLLLLPSQRGGGRSRHGRVQPLRRHRGGHIHQSPISRGFIMGGQRRMRRAMLHLTTGHRSFGSFHGLILFMSIWMCPWKISGEVQWGINWQFTSELETLLDVGGREGMPCILCHPAEVQDRVTPPQHVFIQP